MLTVDTASPGLYFALAAVVLVRPTCFFEVLLRGVFLHGLGRGQDGAADRLHDTRFSYAMPCECSVSEWMPCSDNKL